MISNGLLPMQRSQGQSLITAGRDVFRRLFAFQRSSVLEVCRFSASKWTPKPLNDCRSKRGLNDSFAEFDSTEDEKRILRVPNEYVLRVLNSTGALIREECEIECSRGIFTASPGKICLHLLFILDISVTFISVSSIHISLIPVFCCASFPISFSVFILFNFSLSFHSVPIPFFSTPFLPSVLHAIFFTSLTSQALCVLLMREVKLHPVWCGFAQRTAGYQSTGGTSRETLSWSCSPSHPAGPVRRTMVRDRMEYWSHILYHFVMIPPHPIPLRPILPFSTPTLSTASSPLSSIQLSLFFYSLPYLSFIRDIKERPCKEETDGSHDY
jgi:hypothetical protein